MTGSTGLRNFAQNIFPIMVKCRDGKSITRSEQRQVYQFYAEVAVTLAMNPDEERTTQ